MADTEKCIHGPGCSECEKRREALDRIIRRTTTIIKDDIFELATPQEVNQGRFDGLATRVNQMVWEAVHRASTGDADDLTVEGFIAG